MPPVARYPDTLADVNFGIRYLKANAERFATRPELVGGLGTSSGGHLLLLNVLRPRDPRYTSHPLPAAEASVAFAVVCWPVADNLTPDMAANFAAAYTKAGGSITFHRFEGQPHAFIPRDPTALDAQRALGLITDFIH